MAAVKPQHSTVPPVKAESQNATQIAPDALAASVKPWNEDDYVLALAHLENLQMTITSLRLTIPQLVRSLTRKHASPKELWADLTNEVIGSARRLAELREALHGREMRGVQAHVEESLKERGGGLEFGDELTREKVLEGMRGLMRYGWPEMAEEIKTRRVAEEARRKEEIADGLLAGGEEDLTTKLPDATATTKPST